MRGLATHEMQALRARTKYRPGRRYDAQLGLRMYCHTPGVDLRGSMAYHMSHERRRNQAHTRGRGNHPHA